MREAVALSVAFRHQPEPVRQWFGPGSIVLGDAEYARNRGLTLPRDFAPSLGDAGPSTFRFSYTVPAPARQAFFAESLSNVAVEARFMVQAAGTDTWVEAEAWRWDALIGDARLSPKGWTVTCEAVPWSQSLQARPDVREWSAAEAEDGDTAFHHMRAKTGTLHVESA